MKSPTVVYSIWNLTLGLGILVWQGKSFAEASAAVRSEILFTFAIALFHFIYSIWFWKGKENPNFLQSGLFVRAIALPVYILDFFLFYNTRNYQDLSLDFRTFFLIYLLLYVSVEILHIVSVFFQKLKINSPDWKSFTASGFEYKNRFAFAIYMSLMGVWILSYSQGFLEFFRLPATLFPGFDANGMLFRPIHLIGIHFLMLAYYNLIAVFYQIEPLIEAGMRGGSFTCVFLLALVMLGILSPMVLLIPLVDLVSVGFLLGKKLIKS
ncbi:hypothetical protein [Leptospira sp. 'Mane']|uniref:hypothetical protein n=1 Tax=Leptospira sp. 'Mane' TaxID=3387407 RepID=UPI00398A892A